MTDIRGRNRSPEDRHDGGASRGVRIYYQRAGICVTERHLSVAGQRYEIEDLREVWTERGRRDPLGTGASVVAMVALAIAVGWSYYGRPVVSAGIAAASLLPAGVAITVWKARHRHYELWADYRGTDIQILTLVDGEVYGQICRALIRAREARRAAARPRAEWHSVPRPSPAY